MKQSAKLLVVVGVLGLIGLGGWFWWRAASVPPSMAAAPEAPPAPIPTPAASAPANAIQHPIEDLALQPQPAMPADLAAAVTGLVGGQAALLRLDTLPQRIVATVDGLGREQASPRLWPVNPTEGRFTVEPQGGGSRISADNGLRYTPFVLLLEHLDLQRLVAVYATFYPQFQQAYEDLGYPGRYFNDRLVAVVDQLLLTPDLAAPIGVHLPTANSPVQPTRPWVLYEFDDASLQSLTAGQRLLLRTGPVNQARIKARLRELRSLLTAKPR